MKRSYQQFCALARALDTVGERWTLLLVRELLLGPRRYRDLLDGLPGIGTNLLARRLRELEQAGLVRRTPLTRPARGHGYELTQRGRALDGALLELARWGMDDMAAPDPSEHRQPAWYVLALRAAFRPQAIPGLAEDYQFHVDEETFHFGVRDGTAQAGGGPTPNPAAVLTTDLEAFLAVATGTTEPAELERSGRAQIDGDVAALGRWRTAFQLPALSPR